MSRIDMTLSCDPVVVQRTAPDGAVTFKSTVCPHQISFKSVLLARSEASFLKNDIGSAVKQLWRFKSTVEVSWREDY